MGTGPNRGHRSTCPRFRPYRVHGRKSGLGRQLPRRRAVGMGAPASRDSAFYRCWRRGVRIDGGREDSRGDHHRSHYHDSLPPLAAVQSAHRGKSCQAGGRRPVKGRLARVALRADVAGATGPWGRLAGAPLAAARRRRVARPARPARTPADVRAQNYGSSTVCQRAALRAGPRLPVVHSATRLRSVVPHPARPSVFNSSTNTPVSIPLSVSRCTPCSVI